MAASLFTPGYRSQFCPPIFPVQRAQFPAPSGKFPVFIFSEFGRSLLSTAADLAGRYRERRRNREFSLQISLVAGKYQNRHDLTGRRWSSSTRTAAGQGSGYKNKVVRLISRTSGVIGTTSKTCRHRKPTTALDSTLKIFRADTNTQIYEYEHDS
jgi:hypothetical protein